MAGTQYRTIAAGLVFGLMCLTVSAQSVSPSGVPESLRPLLEADADQALRVARGMRKDLSDAECHVLLAFLLRPSVTANPMEQCGDAVRKNEIMRLLCEQRVPPAGLTDVLIAVVDDEAECMPARDYALQHLVIRHEKIVCPEEASRVQDVLWRCAEHGTGTLSGTSLLALSRLVRRGGEIDSERLGRVIADVARGENVDERSSATGAALEELRDDVPEVGE
ncbi:MAG: hypothetical protein KJ626_12185 [Verrucomicrobia bacterium]|nr:hypothetical protein [Verrucomicrobiota bacterium]